jgi:hypothetical protein
MRHLRAFRGVVTAVALACAFLLTPQAGAASAPNRTPGRGAGPALWADRGDIAALDLYWGIGSAATAPAPPFKFLKEDVSGTKPKVHVTDANGVRWNVKVGSSEIHSEVPASRIAWALGYMVEESYFVESGRVEGLRVETLQRAGRAFGPDGSFKGARFERRPDHIERRKINWAWDANPFVGTRELSGLKLLAVLLNNWDVMPKNNNVLAIRDESGAVREWYLVADWGQTFGRMGTPESHSKWTLDDYRATPFVTGTSGETLQLHFVGYTPELFRSVPLEHARWFYGLISQLSDEQLRAAFRAGGASDDLVEGYAARLRQKIDELGAAVGGAQRPEGETRPRRVNP